MDAAVKQQPRDLDALQRLQRGDESALMELYDRYSSVLYPVAVRILRHKQDAEEALQDTWVYVWKKAQKYLPDHGSVQAWLFSIVRSRALDRYRSRKSRQRAEASAVEQQRQAHLRATELAIGSKSSTTSPTGAATCGVPEEVCQALASLRPEQRQVLEVCYFEGLTHSEVAERFDLPLGTVKTWVRRGLQVLRQSLKRDERV